MEAVRARNMFSKLTLFYAKDSEPEPEPEPAAATAKGDSSKTQQQRGPLCLVRGEGQYVFDDEGRRYLDCVNNVRCVCVGEWIRKANGRVASSTRTHTHTHTSSNPPTHRWRTLGTPTRRSSGRRRGSCGRSTPTRGPSPPPSGP